ncbi:hypothetical protein EUGRSUZ_H00338 [Eucalyptus grandis]|uniref:Uncharacterized protein n=2 Tax=Eucalyptus grandis TaxID=71139 RepID=A0ACC3JJN4_EUCGR|nr:hypothetical protein EUGRSUZ_H00338 [Eucalyptus grandis]
MCFSIEFRSDKCSFLAHKLSYSLLSLFPNTGRSNTEAPCLEGPANCMTDCGSTAHPLTSFQLVCVIGVNYRPM